MSHKAGHSPEERTWPAGEPGGGEGVASDGTLRALHREVSKCRESETVDFAIPSTEYQSQGALPAWIGRFQIEGQLGHGGLGVVLLGRDLELHRFVAIKIPRSSMEPGGELERRFLREGEAVARLSHPHLVPLYEVGRDGPLCYLVSEYCPGPTLAEWLDAHRRPLHSCHAARLVHQLAEAVQHAHSRGVLHRDIKPGNVLLTRLQETEGQVEWAVSHGASSRDFLGDIGLWPKLTDFGLAKLLESAGDETRAGVIIGTPAYMAPEQADGRLHDVDARTDVYALGGILYELLTGVAPCRGSCDVDTLRRLVMEEPVAPRALCPTVPRDLEAVCQKCLAKHAEARYPTAQDLADDLERFLSDRPTWARPTGPAVRLWRWARRRLAMAALVSLALALFAVVVIYNIRLREEVLRTNRALGRVKEEAATHGRLLYSADVQIAYETLKANNVVKAREALERQIPGRGKKDLREFAWYYLHDRCEPDALTLVGHEADVFSVDYSPDGRVLGTAGKDGTARLWNAETGRLLHVLRGHATEVTSVAFAPDGRLLATGSEDCTVRLWNPGTGQAGPVLDGHQDHVMAIAFSSDGRFLASGSRDATVRIWDPATGAAIATLDGDQMDVIRAVAFAPSDYTLFAVDEGGDVHAWRTVDWMRVARAHFNGEKLFALAVSRDPMRLAAAGRRESIWICARVGEQLKMVEEIAGGHTEWIQSLAFSPTDDTLASAGKDGIIRLWKTAQVTPYRTLLGHNGRVWSVAWSPIGRQLASAGADGTVNIWSVAEDAASQYAPTQSELRDPVFSPDGASLVLGDHAGGLSVWSAASRSMSARVRIPHDGSFELDLSPDGTLVATIRKRGVLTVWRAETLEQVASFPLANPSSDALAWAPQGRRLAYTIDDKTVVLRDIGTGRVERRFEHATAVRYLAFTPDGRHLVATSQSLDVWDINSGRVEYSVREAHNRLAVARDRNLIAAGSGSNVTLIDMNSHRPRMSTLVTNGSDVRGLAIHGDTLAVGLSQPEIVSLWDVRTCQFLMRLDCNLESIHGLAFSPDGCRLVAVGRAVGGTGGIQEWSISKRPQMPSG